MRAALFAAGALQTILGVALGNYWFIIGGLAFLLAFYWLEDE